MVSTCWGHWKLNEANGNALDALGVRDLTETGTVPAQTGKINGARGTYSASNHFGITATAFSSNDSFSFCAWVNTPSGSAGNEWWIATNSASGKLMVSLCFHNGKLMFYFEDYSVYGVYASKTISWVANTWYWVCGTYNGSTKEINVYFNNVVGTSATYVGNLSAAATIIWMGVAYAGSDFAATHFYIDDARIYSNVLTSTEMAFIYNSGSGTESELSGAAKFRHFGKFWWKK